MLERATDMRGRSRGRGKGNGNRDGKGNGNRTRQESLKEFCAQASISVEVGTGVPRVTRGALLS